MTRTGSEQQYSEGSGEMFDRIAERYDLLNRLMSLGMDVSWRRKAVSALGVGPGDHILDLATGTADLALGVAARDPTIRVTGLDPSTKMLEIGRHKIERLGFARQIELVAGDAQCLPYADDSFDGLCMAFGIRNVPDRLRALREMARVVRPKRRISLLELSEPGTGWFSGLARWYVHVIVPFAGALLSGAPEYGYLQRSIAAFPNAHEFSLVMEEAGLQVLEVRKLGFGACHLYVASPRETRS